MKKYNKHNSYAVVTGASSGIGEEFARRFAREGFDLVLVARREERLKALAAQLGEQFHSNVKVVEADLSKERGCRQLMREILDLPVTVFVNNAGFGDCGYFPQRRIDKELDMIDVNIKAVHFLTKMILQKMENQKHGYILNVASSAGLMPAGPFMSTYYATKAYVASLTRGIAQELKERGSGIYIGCLCPGPVDTEFDEVANVRFSLQGISPRYCANYAVDQMKKRKVVIVPTILMKMLVVLGRFLPQSRLIAILSRQQRQKL